MRDTRTITEKRFEDEEFGDNGGMVLPEQKDVDQDVVKALKDVLDNITK